MRNYFAPYNKYDKIVKVLPAVSDNISRIWQSTARVEGKPMVWIGKDGRRLFG
jgi:hypothetical protein